MRNFIVSIYEGFLSLLAWIILIVLSILGFTFGQSLIGNGILGLFLGFLLGIVISVIFLGALFQVADIRRNLEQIKNHLIPIDDKKTVEKISNKQKSKVENDGIVL